MFASRFALADEQRDVVSSTRSLCGNLKVFAGAGTGKTTTLVAVAHECRQTRKVLYLAYNSAIRDDARSRFGTSATVHTVHGMAHRATGVRYIKRRFGPLYPSQIESLLGLGGRDIPLPHFSFISAILQTMTAFLCSASDVPDQSHLPPSIKRLNDNGANELVVAMTYRCFEQIAPDAKTTLPLPHDVYLKYWQMIGAPGLDDYDLILMDEAQDSNDVTIAALRSCPAVIWVGDPHQQIYAFRGAVDAMSMVEGAQLPLTQSFRFGPAVAALANSTLARKHRPAPYSLRGLTTKETVIGRIHPGQHHARLYRTNVELLRDAIFFADKGERIAIVGDMSDLRVKLESAWHLKLGERKGVRHPLIASFASWEALRKHVGDSPDPEVGQVFQVIEEYCGRFGDVLSLLGQEFDEASAKIILTTAHRAKGREWDNVVIAADFDNLLLGKRQLQPSEKDAELNLLYVAMTRAMARLELQSQYALGIDNPCS